MQFNPLYFSQMSLTRKAHYTWSKGKFIMARRSKYHVYYLYALRGFYAEIGYTNSLSRIEFIDVFQDMGRLNPYLEAIPLEQMMSD